MYIYKLHANSIGLNVCMCVTMSDVQILVLIKHVICMSNCATPSDGRNCRQGQDRCYEQLGTEREEARATAVAGQPPKGRYWHTIGDDIVMQGYD